jgi:hypothetical protein
MDSEIEKELIDYEPHNDSRPGISSGFDAPTGGRNGRRQHSPGRPAGNGPQPDGWPVRSQPDPVTDATTALTGGQPDATVSGRNGQPSGGYAAGHAGSYGRPGAGFPIPSERQRFQRRHQQPTPGRGAYEGAAYAAGRQLIADVRPPVKERLAVAEHEINDLNSLYATVYEQILLSASHDDMREHFASLDTELNRRIQSVHSRIDNEVLPDVRNLQHRRVVRDWAISLSLAASIVYNVVLTVKHLLQ